MYAGETRELADGEVLRDLLAAGYIEKEPEKRPEEGKRPKAVKRKG